MNHVTKCAEKTLGQIAYEAETNFDPLWIKEPYIKLSVVAKRRWNKIASAVAREARKRSRKGDR